jgi:N-carbamoylputrescine amidase
VAPIPGDIRRNRSLIERGIHLAATSGADWVVTPEFGVCGYGFVERIGTEWILPQPDRWMRNFCRLVATLKMTIFLCHPERDRQTGRLHNTLFAIDSDGKLAGKHRKINVLPGSESWATGGVNARSILVDGMHVGMLVCADVCTPGIYNHLKLQGAEVLVSGASWGLGPYEPNGEWEQCSLETGLPLFVCNRTGVDTSLDFSGAETVIVQGGRRLLSFHSCESAVLLVEWDRERRITARDASHVIPL